MKLVGQVALLVGLAFIGAAGTHFFHPRAPAWRQVEEPVRDDEVTVEMVGQRWKNNVLWIDARPAEQFAKDHIPDAININEQERDQQLFDHITLLQDNMKPVVIYCDSSACQASRKLKDFLAERLPIGDLYVLRGGWSAWKESRSARR